MARWDCCNSISIYHSKTAKHRIKKLEVIHFLKNELFMKMRTRITFADYNSQVSTVMKEALIPNIINVIHAKSNSNSVYFLLIICSTE